MRVQVDEARRDDQSLDVQHAFSAQLGRRYRRDFAVADADVANGVKPRRGVHYMSVSENEIILLGLQPGDHDE